MDKIIQSEFEDGFMDDFIYIIAQRNNIRC